MGTVYKPDYNCHPLETVIETLSYYDISFSELCIDGLTFEYWKGYEHGRNPLTDTAVHVIERVAGIPAEFMRRLDTQYQKEEYEVSQ
jgi:hypothetical protein